MNRAGADEKKLPIGCITRPHVVVVHRPFQSVAGGHVHLNIGIRELKIGAAGKRERTDIRRGELKAGDDRRRLGAGNLRAIGQGAEIPDGVLGQQFANRIG